MSGRLRSRAIGSAQYAGALCHFGAVLAGRSGSRGAPIEPTWPASAELRSRVAIRWPTTYQWPLAGHWVGALRENLAALVPVTAAEIEQPYEGTVLIEVSFDGRPHEVAIDYFDRSRLLDEVAERCPLVFKMQYRGAGYGHPHVVPGGYVAGKASLHHYLPALRRIHDRSRPRFDVYGRFGAQYAQDTRQLALRLLSTQDRFGFEGSLVTRPYAAYLREAALGRICLDLPGNGDMCHRLLDYLAIGCCIVRPAPETALHVPLRDGVNIRFADPDLSNLVDICAELLDDERQRNRLALAAREHYERYLRPDQLAGYYLDRCASLLSA